MAATGFAWFFGNFATTGVEPVDWVGAHALYLYRGPLVHLLVTYPSGRVSSRLDRAAVAVGYAAAVLTPVWRSELATIVLALLLAGALVGLVFELLWLVITGLVIGALGRLVLPGQQQIGLLATALVGIAASLLGGILADVFDTGWLIQFLVAVALAAIGITIFASSERERSSSAI